MYRLCITFSMFLLVACDHGGVETNLSSERVGNNIAQLASDSFEGRAPFTQGETKTINFIKEQFIAAGLSPANNGDFFQEVSLVQLTNVGSPQLTLLRDGVDRSLEYRKDAVIWSTHITEKVQFEESELVYVGFGIVAPEYGRNDYAGVDVRGKTVVMFINDPGYHLKTADYFKGLAMTYYGRWTYKFEEAARQGAAGALLIHEDGAAAYGWNVIQGWSRPHFNLLSEHKNLDNAAIEGWISSQAAQQLFSDAGTNLNDALNEALKRDFKPKILKGFSVSAALEQEIVYSKSYNVVGVLPGRARPEEVVLYMGHWDHLGVNTALEGDQIYNGAVDNATGIAALIELANAFASQDRRPQRSILFLAVTAEESGLLGSEYYTENPLYPLSKTVAAINMDAMNNIAAAKDVVVIGYGSSELEDYLAKQAKKQGRYLSPESTPEKGIFYRSDHFNFAKKGVPALYTDSGIELIGKEKGYGAKMILEYSDQRYHTPADEYQESWELSGIMSDIELYFLLGNDLANTTDFPNWYEGNEFRTTRDESLNKK